MTRSRCRSRRPGFTLLEVLLALAILVGSLATIGVLVDQGFKNAHRTTAISKAQLYCESKLAEISAGVVLPAPVSAAPLDVDPEWSYSVEATPDAVDPALLSVRVTVTELVAPPLRPVEFSLVRWVTDPSATSTEATTATSSTSTTSSAASGGSE